MTTECTAAQLEFHGLGRRVVLGKFDGGTISSDRGGLLLREVELRTHILKRLAGCFVDYRDPGQIEHRVESLIKQRVMRLALGYEDLNDHDALRQDPLLVLLSEVADPTGQGRKRAQDKGCALAGKSTHRLELTPGNADAGSRCKKIVAQSAAMDELLVTLFLQAYETAPEEIILDADATDDPLHGNQGGRFFHGHYRHYCYPPLYIFSVTAPALPYLLHPCSRAVSNCCVPVCAKPIRTAQPVPKRNWSASSGVSVRAGPRPAS